MGEITNGREVIEKSIKFLTTKSDPLLFIAPEGSDSTYRNQIVAPHQGFAIMAREAQAQILPTIFTGDADLQNLRFSMHGQVLPPFDAFENDTQTMSEWSKRMNEALK